jgi:predicted CopG family antitoxin
MKGNSKTFKQILIDEINYQSLKLLGNAGDSFNDVITRLLKNSHCNGDLVTDHATK